MDVDQGVQRDVRAERLEHEPLRLERVDETLRSRQPGQREGVRADVGANIQRHVARRDEAAEHAPPTRSIAVQLEDGR